jgi:cytochrome c oxidase subunit 2
MSSLFPPQASTIAPEMDALYMFLTAVSVIMTVLIFIAVFYSAIKFRRRDPAEIPRQVHGSIPLEIAWSVIPFGIMLIMFAWGAKLYFDTSMPPANSIDLYVTGKQWMWKIQHPDGQREINEVHVPVGQPVRLILSSEDVIHSFFIPAFRIKRDVVPGSYEKIWFEATKPGRYHLFCAEYCGTDHSRMIGWVTAMEPAEYETWLQGGTRRGTMAEHGAELFQQYGCINCHMTNAQARCPPLQNVFGRPVKLNDGRTVMADEAYVRESILNPNAKIVEGYERDIMPIFQGQIDEDGLLALIAYIKSLSSPGAASMPAPAEPGKSSNAKKATGGRPTGGKQ